ncbi:hypothetical protein D3C81_1482950 [compost metagenome]
MADKARQHARIDVGNAGNAVFLEQVTQIVLGPPVAWGRFIAANHKAVNRWCNGFKVVARNAIVPDQRIRHRDDLPAVRRIGQHLLVPRNSRIKNDLPRLFPFRSK